MRYVTRPRSAPDGDWDDPLLPPISVTDHRPINTGIVDQHGDPILRVMPPIGFGRDKEH